MSAPAPDYLPPALRTAFGEWSWTEAWRYGDRPTVWRLTQADERVLFVKIGRHDQHPTMADEVARLRWARPYVTVATVVGHGAGAGYEWFEMEPLPGVDATVHRWRSEPSLLVPALANALREFHNDLPVGDCPFDRRAAASLEHIRRRVAASVIDDRDFHEEFRHLTAEDALREFERLMPDETDLVVCHGDYCLPNVMLDDAGQATGYLDLGELAVADRRSDIVVGAWSVTWNLGPAWEQLFYDSYGLVPTLDEISFYRLLYELES